MAKKYHHGDLKSAILQKAVEIIQKKGEVDFTLREIAESLKVSHTAVYRHFKSKRDLLSHIAEEGFLALSADFESSIKGLRTPRQKLHVLGKCYIEFAFRNQGHYRSMFHQELRCGEEVRPELEAAGHQAFSILESVIQEGMRTQIFLKDSSAMAARTIWSAVHGFSTLLIDGQFQSLTTIPSIREGIEAHLKFVERCLLK